METNHHLVHPSVRLQVVPKHRAPLLPRKTRHCKAKTLVLDLDETLVHSCLEAHALADFTFPVHFNSHEHIIHVRQRPHLHTFLEVRRCGAPGPTCAPAQATQHTAPCLASAPHDACPAVPSALPSLAPPRVQRMAELYEVVVFTASQKIYAEKLLNIIDPERRLVKHRIFRESCVVRACARAKSGLDPGATEVARRCLGGWGRASTCLFGRHAPRCCRWWTATTSRT